MHRLRRLSVVAGVMCITIAVALLLTTTVAFDGHTETINGQHNTDGVLPEIGLLCLGMLFLAFGLP